MAIRDALTRPRNWAAGTAILLAAIVEASLWIPGFYDELVAWQTAIAALLGFGGLIVAALFNAELNRRRDDRQRASDVRALASALCGELGGAASVLATQRQSIEAVRTQITEHYPLTDVAHLALAWTFNPVVYRANAQSIGGLPLAVAEVVCELYAQVGATLSATDYLKSPPAFLDSMLRALDQRLEFILDRIDMVRVELAKVAGIPPPDPVPRGKSF